MQRLSVFAGGCDLAAAEAVLPDDELDAVDVVDVLGQLVDKSLVVVDDATTAGCVTGCSRPSASTPASDSTRVATRSRCDVATPTTTSRWPKRPVRTYGAESTSSGPASSRRDIDNFRAALDWAVETPSPEHALRLVAPLAVGGRTGELAMDWAATAIAIPGGDGHPLFPVVAAWAAWGATMGLDFERAEDLVAAAERAQAALGTRLASVARAQALLAFYRNDFEGARRHAAGMGRARASIRGRLRTRRRTHHARRRAPDHRTDARRRDRDR